MMHGLTYHFDTISISGVECQVTKGTVSINKLLRHDMPTNDIILNLNWSNLVIPKRLKEEDETNFFSLSVEDGTRIQGRLLLKGVEPIASVLTTSDKPEVTRWVMYGKR